MQNQKETQERRRRRSELLQPAVTLQLEHIKEKYQLNYVGAANVDGFFVAGSEDTNLSRALAGYAPEIAETEDQKLRQRLFEDLKGHFPEITDTRLAVEKFFVDDQPLYFFATGSDAADLSAPVEHAVSGIQRIFKTT